MPCEVLEVEPARLLACRFGDGWTLTSRLVATGSGTRLLLEHAGFDLDDRLARDAFTRMGPGWRDEILPALLTWRYWRTTPENVLGAARERRARNRQHSDDRWSWRPARLSGTSWLGTDQRSSHAV